MWRHIKRLSLGIPVCHNATTLDSEAHLTPKQAAKRIGISTSGLRRLAGEYAKVYGPLPRDESTDARLWPESALERLAKARELTRLDPDIKSVKEALEALEKGIDLSAADLAPTQAPQIDAAAVVDLLQSMRDEIAELRREIIEQRREISELRDQGQHKQLPEAATGTRRRPWWRFWGKG
jgi:DNA-binding transcriptional MerR regulator